MKKSIVENQLGKVLIIDDDEDVLLAAKMVLKKYASQVLIEKNPKKIPFLLNNDTYDLILLDEPTAGLDATSEILVLEALHKLAEAGKTLVFSTHHQALLALADQVLIVNDGEVRHA